MPNTEFDWQVAYPHPRTPVFASNIVATSQPLAAQAGLQMLQRGGNAVDAAIAAAAAITVVEPVSNGLGSDAFAIVWDGKKPHGLNGSGRSPAAWDTAYFMMGGQVRPVLSLICVALGVFLIGRNLMAERKPV